MTIAFLFPGQGPQSKGLLQHLPQHAEVARTIAEASQVLALDLDAPDNTEALHSTVAVRETRAAGRPGAGDRRHTGGGACPSPMLLQRHPGRRVGACSRLRHRYPLPMPCDSSVYA